MPLVVSDLTPLLQVFDMKRSLAFYRDSLGFRIEAQSEPGDDFDWGLLRLGPAALMLNTAYERNERPANPDLARQAVHVDTGLFFYCPDLDEAYSFLVAQGLDVKPPTVQPYGMRQIHVSDPDDYVLCFQQNVTSN